MVASPVLGEVRIQSDQAIARDILTTCSWQSLTNDHTLMQNQFAQAMFRLAILGQNENDMIDCSMVVPRPIAIASSPHFPPTLHLVNVEAAVRRCSELSYGTWMAR